jgi:MraZ protein
LTFRGRYDYALDAKNRLTVPPKFRRTFADGVVVANGLDACVELWTPDGFEAFTESFLAGQHPLSEERRKLVRYFAGSSFDVELDSAGRVTLTASLLAHAGMARDVVVVGALDHLEAWDRSRFEAHRAELDAEVAGIARTVGHAS